jgi:hypothetical protein
MLALLALLLPFAVIAARLAAGAKKAAAANLNCEIRAAIRLAQQPSRRRVFPLLLTPRSRS